MNDRSFTAAQRFLLAAKGQWTTTLYSRLREEYAAKCTEQRTNPASVAEVAELVEDLTFYPFFAWLERHLQIAKYAGRYGLAPYYAERREAVLHDIETVPAGDSILELHPELPMPDYYRAIDIHQHPGGVWSDDVAGLVYEHGARSTTPLLGASHADLHTRFTERVVSEGEVSHVLDLGCGFGKSTMPFALLLPKAEIKGVDLAAPCLRVAAHTARSKGCTNVRFKQAHAAETGYEDGSFDLVTSTMLLHEIPPKVLDKVLDECRRVLKPGGRLVHLDFWHFPDAFARFMLYGHGRRNNEPYMQPLAELDLPQVLRNKGFTDIQITPFQESPSADLSAANVWRFPWTYISARKK